VADLDERGNPTTSSNPGRGEDRSGKRLLARDEYAEDQERREALLELRREQDLRLVELMEKSISELTSRLASVEAGVNGVHKQCDVIQTMLLSIKESRAEILSRQQNHEKRIGALEQSVAGLKAWILVVGGLTGIASFLAIVLK